MAYWHWEPILHKSRQNHAPFHSATPTQSHTGLGWADTQRYLWSLWGFLTWASVGEGNVPTKFKKRNFCTWIHLPFFHLKCVVPVTMGSTCLIRKKYFFEILLNHCPQQRKWKYYWWLARQTNPFFYCKCFSGKLLLSDFHFTFFMLKKQFYVPALVALGRYGFN